MPNLWPFGSKDEARIDPVCHMNVLPSRSAATSEHAGTTYYFCGPGCKVAFDREPAAYLSGEKKLEM